MKLLPALTVAEFKLPFFSPLAGGFGYASGSGRPRPLFHPFSPPLIGRERSRIHPLFLS